LVFYSLEERGLTFLIFSYRAAIKYSAVLIADFDFYEMLLSL
jgi:hypothetical protein